MKETEYDFWRMIFEYKVEIIVMLTNCMEDRKVCISFWLFWNEFILAILLHTYATFRR